MRFQRESTWCDRRRDWKTEGMDAAVDDSEWGEESRLLVEAAQAVWDGDTQAVRVDIPASPQLVERMRGEGVDLLESVFITDSDMRHIRRQHSSHEEQRGQVSLGPLDFAAIPLVVNGFDSCEYTQTDRLGNRKFLLARRVGGVYYVVLVQRGRRRLQVKTMWKRSAPPRAQSEGNQSEEGK